MYGVLSGSQTLHHVVVNCPAIGGVGNFVLTDVALGKADIGLCPDGSRVGAVIRAPSLPCRRQFGRPQCSPAVPVDVKIHRGAAGKAPDASDGAGAYAVARVVAVAYRVVLAPLKERSFIPHGNRWFGRTNGSVDRGRGKVVNVCFANV